PVVPTDALTSAGSRTALQARLENIGEDLERASLAVIDLDRFKSVNDSLGRDAADVALAAFTERLLDAVARQHRSVNLFRVGGDMFAALAQDLTDPVAFWESVIGALRTPFMVADREVYLDASIGVASGRDAGDGPEMLANGERAMVEAKLQGGGRVV